MLDAKIASAWTRSSKTPTLRRSVLRNRKPRKRIGFYEEDRSPSWSATTLELLALMIPFLITLIYSQYEMGWSFIIDDKNSIEWYSGKSVQIEDAWVWSTQNCIGVVRHGRYRCPIIKNWKTTVKRSMDQKLRLRNFWRQTWENRNRCSGQ